MLALASSLGFSFLFYAGFHVVLATLDFRKNSSFLDFFLEALQCTFDTFTRLDLDLCQLKHPLYAGYIADT